MQLSRGPRTLLVGEWEGGTGLVNNTFESMSIFMGRKRGKEKIGVAIEFLSPPVSSGSEWELEKLMKSHPHMYSRVVLTKKGQCCS